MEVNKQIWLDKELEDLNFFQKIKRRYQCYKNGHKLVWINNFYGDTINYMGGDRSSWLCVNCNKVIYRPELGSDERIYLRDNV